MSDSPNPLTLTPARWGAHRGAHVLDLPLEWLDDVWATTNPRGGRKVPQSTPSGGRAAVKVYPGRPSHNWVRRLRPGRAAREGAGYLAFSAAGVPVIPLLAWGERRRLAFLQSGVVVTAWIEAPTVAQAYAASPEPELLEAAARLLARIHAAGLCHGDARTHNFFATEEETVAFDLPSWSRGAAGVAKDLERFLGSALKLGAEELLPRLCELMGGGKNTAQHLARARVYAASKNRP